jgi:hypothetical protein
MTLGTKLNTYIEQHDRKQAEVAATWLERWNGQGGKTWSGATIASHLNRLLKDQPQGAQFFFRELKRGALLFDVLNIPASEHAELFELAERAMKTEGAPPRVVVDATGWTQGVPKAEVLFAELKRCLITEGPYPISLVILEEQYDRLPRSFDDYKDKVRVVRVKDAAEGWECTQELADEQGLVLSYRRFSDFERWLAADFEGGVLRLEPANGLELFRAQGRLPTLEPVTHDLTDLVPPGSEERVWLPDSACEQHRLMRALRSEKGATALGQDAASRQGLARMLGLTATSTSQERLKAKVESLGRELPVGIQSAQVAELEAQLEQAQRRRVGPLALWIGDTVHLINVPNAAQIGETRPWVRVHDVQPRPTALSVLLEAVGKWSEFDFLLDPFLDQLILRLTPEEKERLPFLHARAGLLQTHALQPTVTAPVSDWKPILDELLASDPPPALLRSRMSGKKIWHADRERPPFLVTAARAQAVKQAECNELTEIAPVGEVLLSRQDELLLVGGAPIQQENSWSDRATPPILIPKTSEVARDPERWLDIYEGCQFGTKSRQEKGSGAWLKYRSDLHPGVLLSWATAPFAIAEEIWEQADRELAMAWLALRMALVQPQSIRLPDGAILLRLGGPFFAEIRVHPLAVRGEPKQVQGSLLLDIEFQRVESDRYGKMVFHHQLKGVSDLVTTHTVKGGYDFGALLPKRIHLSGERFCADIRFRGSALFAESSQSLPYAAAVARIDTEAEAERRRAQDDDDDD